MRPGPDSAVLAGAAGWSPQVSAWKGTTLLAAQVPVISGRLSVTEAQEVPERLTFTVPEWAPEIEGGPYRSWVPDSPDHPLASFGQFVSVDIRVTSSVRAAEWITRLGRFVVQDWDHDDIAGTVSVECVGVLQRVLDARFRVPEVPRAGGTFASEFRRLMVAGVPVSIHPDLVDRAVPRSFEWPEDRLGALYDLVEAWPARLRVDDNGAVMLLPPLPADPLPVLTLTDGERGTVISAPRSGGRDGIFNVVVGTSSADDPSKAPVRVVREVTSGPLAVGVYGEVVKKWASPLATTEPAMAAAVTTLLANSVRPAVTQRATIVPDPRIELDDPLELVRGVTTRFTGRTTATGGWGASWGTAWGTASGSATTLSTETSTEDATVTHGWVVGYDLPLTADGGPMTVTVGVA